MFSKFFIDRPVFATVIALLMVLGGSVVLRELPVAQFPDITPPTVQVTASYPGASAETVARTVAAPIEEQVNGVDGMIYMSSTSSSSGEYTLTVTFGVGTDIDMAAVLVQNRVEIAQGNLPSEVISQGITTKKQSSNIVMILSLESDTALYDGLYLSNYASLNLTDPLSRLPGVGNITVFGSGDYGMRVWLDPEIMRIRGVTPQEVYDAVTAQNVEVSAGGVGMPPVASPTGFQYTLTAKGRLRSPEEFGNIIIKALPGGGYLRLKEIARVELGSSSYNTVSKQDGKASAAIAIYQSPGSNALEVADLVEEKIGELSESFPQGVVCKTVLNTTDFVSASISEVVVTLVETTLLVMLVILLFLQNLRAVIIPSLTIPVSLVCTFAVMGTAGFSINTLTMFAMVLAIAIVVDDAIVVVENASRLIDSGRYTPKEAVTAGMKEITGPVISVVLVLLAVFVPTAFVPGVTGELYKQFALTISAATFFSGFNSLTLTPALCALFLKPSGKNKPVLFRRFDGYYDKLTGKYVRAVTYMLKRERVTMSVFAAITAIAAWLYAKHPTSFIPQEDQGYFIVSVQLPPGASLQRTEAVTERITGILNRLESVRTSLAINGFSLLQGGSTSNGATLFVVLEPWDERKSEEKSVHNIIAELNRECADIEEAIVFAVNPPAIQGMGNSGGLQFELEDRNNMGSAALQSAIDDILSRSPDVKSAGMMNSSYQGENPQYFLKIDREKCEMQGISIDDVFRTLSLYMGSAYVNDFVLFGKVYQVLLSGDAAARNRISDVIRLAVSNSEGEMVPFSSFTEVEKVLGRDIVSRYNMYDAAAITVVPAATASSRQAIDGVGELAEEVLGNSFALEWTGEAYQENNASSSVAAIFLLAVLVAFLVLAAQYENWTSPVAVIMGLPFAILGAVAGCVFMGLPLSIYSQIGIILLIALSAKNAILIVEFAAGYRAKGESLMTAAVEAGRVRLRPILMTSLAFIVGVMPMVFASGAGAASRVSLGTAVVSGMLASTLFGTLFIPNFYIFMQKVHEKFRKGSGNPPPVGKR